MWLDRLVRTYGPFALNHPGYAHLAVFLSSAVALHGCGDTGCPAGGCEGDSLNLYMEASAGTLPPGLYTVAIDTDAGTMGCMIDIDPNVTGGFSGTCDRDLWTLAAPCILDPNPLQSMQGECGSFIVRLGTAPQRFDFRYLGVLSHLSVNVERDGAGLLDETMKPYYKVIWDSDECNLHCTQADIRLELP